MTWVALISIQKRFEIYYKYFYLSIFVEKALKWFNLYVMALVVDSLCYRRVAVLLSTGGPGKLTDK